MFNSGKTEPEKHRWFGNVKTTFCKHCILFQRIQANKIRVVVDYKAGKDYLQCLQTYPKKISTADSFSEQEDNPGKSSICIWVSYLTVALMVSDWLMSLASVLQWTIIPVFFKMCCAKNTFSVSSSSNKHAINKSFRKPCTLNETSICLLFFPLPQTALEQNSIHCFIVTNTIKKM